MDRRWPLPLIAALVVAAAVASVYTWWVNGRGSPECVLPRVNYTSGYSGFMMDYRYYNGSIIWDEPLMVNVSRLTNFSVRGFIRIGHRLRISNSSEALERAYMFLGKVLVAPRGDYMVSVYADIYTGKLVVNETRGIDAAYVTWHVSLIYMYRGYRVYVELDIDGFEGNVIGFHVVGIAREGEGEANTWRIRLINNGSPLVLRRHASISDMEAGAEKVFRIMGLVHPPRGKMVLYRVVNNTDIDNSILIRYIYTYMGKSPVRVSADVPPGEIFPYRFDVVVENDTITRAGPAIPWDVPLPPAIIGVYNGTVLEEGDAVRIADRFMEHSMPSSWRCLARYAVREMLYYRKDLDVYAPLYIVVYRPTAAASDNGIYVVAVDGINGAVVFESYYGRDSIEFDSMQNLLTATG